VPSPELNPSSFSQDTLEFLRLLDEHGVRYVVVGGQAVIYYGYPRLTGDLDLFFDGGSENASRLHQALLEFWGGDIPSVDSAEELGRDGLILQFGRPPNRIDLMNRVDGLEFNEAWDTRLELEVPLKGKEIKVHYVSLGKLIQNKEAAGRPRDQEDLTYLRRAEQGGASGTPGSETGPKKS